MERAIQLEEKNSLIVSAKAKIGIDRDFDFQDCIKMNPSQKELDECFEWVSERDANPGWRKNVENHFVELKKELGHGI